MMEMEIAVSRKFKKETENPQIFRYSRSNNKPVRESPVNLIVFRIDSDVQRSFDLQLKITSCRGELHTVWIIADGRPATTEQDVSCFLIFIKFTSWLCYNTQYYVCEHLKQKSTNIYIVNLAWKVCCGHLNCPSTFVLPVCAVYWQISIVTS